MKLAWRYAWICTIFFTHLGFCADCIKVEYAEINCMKMPSIDCVSVSGNATQDEINQAVEENLRIKKEIYSDSKLRYIPHHKHNENTKNVIMSIWGEIENESVLPFSPNLSHQTILRGGFSSYQMVSFSHNHNDGVSINSSSPESAIFCETQYNPVSWYFYADVMPENTSPDREYAVSSIQALMAVSTNKKCEGREGFKVQHFSALQLNVEAFVKPYVVKVLNVYKAYAAISYPCSSPNNVWGDGMIVVFFIFGYLFLIRRMQGLTLRKAEIAKT